MKRVEITSEMKLIARLLGGMRVVVNRGAGTRDRKMGGQDGFSSDEDGVLAELAFAQAFNVCPDLSLRPRSGSADAIVAGKRIDIKATRRTNGQLIATTKENADIDLYVLAIVEDQQVTFPGFALASELKSDANLTDLGHGQTYAMPQDKLRKFKEAP